MFWNIGQKTLKIQIHIWNTPSEYLNFHCQYWADKFREKFESNFYPNKTVAVPLSGHTKDFVLKWLGSTSVWIAPCETKVWFHYLSKATWPRCEKLINFKWKIISSEKDGWDSASSFSCKWEENDFWLKDGLARGLTPKENPCWEQIGYDCPESKGCNGGHMSVSTHPTFLKLAVASAAISQEGFR